MKRFTECIAATGLTAGLLLAGVGLAPAASAAAGGGNLSCPAGTTTLKLDRAPVLHEVITDGTLAVTITKVYEKLDGSGEVYGFDYSADGTVLQTIVKGGPTAIAYDRTELLATRKAGTPSGTHYEISNIQFCY